MMVTPFTLTEALVALVRPGSLQRLIRSVHVDRMNRPDTRFGPAPVYDIELTRAISDQ